MYDLPFKFESDGVVCPRIKTKKMAAPSGAGALSRLFQLDENSQLQKLVDYL